MNTSLSTFMKIAITVIVIVASLWDILVPMMGDLAENISSYVWSNS